MGTVTELKPFKIPGTVKLTANGDGAKSVKVSVLARTGDAISIPGWGMVVHDFEGMEAKTKIPLDLEHDKPIGFLNKFDVATGDLVCSGAIVIDADSETTVNKML